MNTIRASMLPGYPDCPRRAAAKQYRDKIEAAGFELRRLRPSVGAAVGTAAHAAAATVNKDRIDGGDFYTEAALRNGITRAVAGAVQGFEAEIATGAEWDDTTPNVLIAKDQIARMADVAIRESLESTPRLAESPMAATLPYDGWRLTGTVDLLTIEDAIEDLKTGALKRPYQSQLGGYALLAKANGYQVEQVSTTFVARVRKNKPQPPADRQDYDLAVAENAAKATIVQIVRDVTAFEQDGDPYAFLANPMSLMCSARYCPAHGTEFCHLWLPKTTPAIELD